MLQMTSLGKVYRTEEVETAALHDINIRIDEGEFIAIMGPSGCGKSTLLNIVGLLDSPSSGEYRFQGQEVSGFNERQRAKLRKESIGFIFQSFNLVDELTVAENVDLALLYHGIAGKERKQRVTAALEQLNIAHRAKHFPKQLSGGQQQRVAVARAIVSLPVMILADEPTGNLDTANGEDVMDMLTELNGGGTTIVMVTHSHPHAEYAERVINLLDGQVVSEHPQLLRRRQLSTEELVE